VTETNNLINALNDGRAAHQNGDMEAARDHYVRALEIKADDPDVLHALAAVELQLGHLRLAESHQREAIQINKFGVGYQNQLGDILAELKQLRELLGCALIEDGRPEDGVTYLRTALQLDPGYATTYAYLGHLNAQMGRAQQAEAHYSRALQLDPGNLQALSGAGNLHEQNGELALAIASYRRVLDIEKDNIPAIRSLASIWERQGVWARAEEFYRRAHKIAPASIEILHELADVQLTRRHFDSAINSYEKALQVRPSDQHSLAEYGRLRAMTGDTKLALSKLSTAVQGGFVETSVLCSYARLLSAAQRGREGVALLEQRLRGRCSNEELCQLHFVLGDLHAADASYDLAFHNYRKGNLLKQARFNTESFDQHCSRLLETFSAGEVAFAPRVESSGEGLVFLIGMPRSGVRVLEKFLQTLNGVTSSGTSPFVETTAYRMSAQSKQQWPGNIGAWDIGKLSGHARMYLERARMNDLEANVYLDATWRNFLYVGLIEMMFPDAKLVYCARDYRDIALSCYCHDFGQKKGASFTYNLQNIAAYMRSHKRVMAHWKAVSSLPMHVVSYERMILDFDDETAALTAFLGLSENRVREPQDAVKLPKPSSLRSTSLRKFRHYRNHLESFAEDLGTPPDIPF